ncbi:MAG: hypothetical protein P1U68_03925 [Verrucomicrobiales bacterium]|nr:hypothetical protein [Verrucomicrobiales bacterium]
MNSLAYSIFSAQSTPPADDIYDIVVLAPKDTVWPLVFWSALAFIIIGALGWMIWYLLRGSSGKEAGPSPESIAFRRFTLAHRDREDLSPNEYSLALSEALKDYLAAKYGDPVRFETTPEFLSRISQHESKMPAAAQQQLEAFLIHAEEIKFGNCSDAQSKAAPLGKTAEQIVQLCQMVNEK